jgi:hypothetical protein
MCNLSHHLCPKSISISFSNSVKSKSGQNTGATVSHVKQEEDISTTGQSITPNGGKTPYIGNQEMSDKSRNRLQKKMP